MNLDFPKVKRKGFGYVTIYALRDPRNKEVFYVGRSLNPETRYKSHMSEADRYKNQSTTWYEKLLGVKTTREKDGEGNARKIRRILSIKEMNLEPELVILDRWFCATIQDANKFEDAWIAEMRRRNEPLTNYIYSHRMSPKYYSKNNKFWKEGWALSPLEYIKHFKDKIVEDVPDQPRKKLSRSKLSKISRRIINKTKGKK